MTFEKLNLSAKYHSLLMQFQKHLQLQRANQSISTLILSDHPFSSSAQYEKQPLLHNYGIFPDTSLCSLISFTVFFYDINLAALAVFVIVLASVLLHLVWCTTFAFTPWMLCRLLFLSFELSLLCIFVFFLILKK